MAGVLLDASAALEALLGAAPRRRLVRNSVVYGEGDSPDHVWFIHDGLVKLVTTAVHGATSLVAFRGPGEWLGEHSAIDGRPRLATAVVVRDTTLTTVDREVLEAAVRGDPDLAMSLLASLAGHVRASTRHVLALASGDPTALVARRLLTLVSDRRFAVTRTVESGVVSIDMPISHDELSTWAGVSRRSVEAALKNLRSAGAISTGRMKVVVLDRAVLKRRALGAASEKPPTASA